MKNLIGWGALLAVLGIISYNLGEWLAESGLVPFIVGGTIVFAATFNILGVKLVKSKKTTRRKTSKSGYKRKPRSTTRPGALNPTTRPRQEPPVGHYRTNGSYIPEQYRNNQNPI